jgi:succinyl-CoA synthetase beta subunit
MAQLFDLLAKLAHLMTASDRIQEIDLNPVMIKKDGTLIAVDARVVVGN